MLALATLLNAVHRMKIAWLQIVSQVQSLATAVLTAIRMQIVAVILSTYAQKVSENMSILQQWFVTTNSCNTMSLLSLNRSYVMC